MDGEHESALHAAVADTRAADDAARRRLALTLDTFRQWQHLPDPEPLYVVLATVAANLMLSDPTWLLLVGPPGGVGCGANVERRRV
jgi:hypothetical protein